MLRFKYYICERDLIFVASGHMECVKFNKKKPKNCRELNCDADFIAVYITTDHPDNDGKIKRKRTDKVLEGNRKKRQAPRKILSRNSRNRRTGRPKNTRPKVISKR